MIDEAETVTSNTEIVRISRTEYDELQAEQEALKAKIAELTKQRDWLAERLKLSSKKLFGASSEESTEELDDQLCPQRGEGLHVMGKEVVSEQLKIIPAKAVLVQHVRYSYACRNCAPVSPF